MPNNNPSPMSKALADQFLEMGAQLKGPDSYFFETFPLPHGLRLSDLEAELLSREGLPRGVVFMKYRGKQLARTKEFFWYLQVDDWNGAGLPRWVPIYHYPGWQWLSTLFYRSMAEKLPQFARVVEVLNSMGDSNADTHPLTFNHAILTLYKSAEDNIGWHSDKVKDIEPGSYVLLFSFGATREFQLRWIDKKRKVIPLIMKSGSAFFMGPETNRLMQHRLAPVAEERSRSLRADRIIKPRVSLVLRNIKLYDQEVVVQETRKRLPKLAGDAERFRAAKAVLDKTPVPAALKRTRDASPRRRRKD